MPPAEFDRCVQAGGRVRTKTLSGGRYLHLCFLNGKSFAGEVRTKQKATKIRSKSHGG